ncbi:hypothetical protein N0V87_000909 [Didymella glomerata]|uniref:Uncharacterized protein n=1 Tax=Didymella glomerata TaxID=749621 RepID=A0A9W8X703_9PLEO|nr:hypothetical protein N0V87_000909 [Didymella glomerata]
MGALQTYNPGQFLELISQDPKASADFRYLPETDKLESNTIEADEGGFTVIKSEGDDDEDSKELVGKNVVQANCPTRRKREDDGDENEKQKKDFIKLRKSTEYAIEQWQKKEKSDAKQIAELGEKANISKKEAENTKQKLALAEERKEELTEKMNELKGFKKTIQGAF